MSVALLRRAITRFGNIFAQVYGMTEAMICTLLLPHQHLPDGSEAEARRLASAGQPFLNAALRVVRDDGTHCDVEEIGEILVGGPTVMSGYWNNTALTVEVMKQGWFDSGDRGFCDSEGFLFVADRKKDMIVTGGENVYSREVEEALLTHQAVAEAAVIAVPDREWGEAVKACVVLKPGLSADPAELIEHCRTRLAGYKKPRSIDLIGGTAAHAQRQDRQEGAARAPLGGTDAPGLLTGDGRAEHGHRQRRKVRSTSVRTAPRPRPSTERITTPAMRSSVCIRLPAVSRKAPMPN